jgi:glycosyltransferase involved in cell wall biosynthesis
MPLVSVVMSVFNRESLVGDAIRSIQQQTLEDWELIILDDGSTDRSLEICRSFEAQDSRIHVYANGKNLGLGETRKRAMTFATGKYVANHDSDDISEPYRLKHQVELLDSQPHVGLVTGIAAWLDDQDRILRYFPDILVQKKQYPQNKTEMVKLLYRSCEVPITACMFRRPLSKFFPGAYRIVDDWHFLLDVAHRELIWGIPEVLVKMRRGTTHQYLWKGRSTRAHEVRKFMRNVYENYKDDPDSPVDYWLYKKSLAPWLAEEGRNVGGWKGYLHVLQAVAFDPSNEVSWKSLWNLSERALRKARRLTLG